MICLYLLPSAGAQRSRIPYQTSALPSMDDAKLKTLSGRLDKPPNYGDKCSKWTGRPV